jgi:hypothetical protein
MRPLRKSVTEFMRDPRYWQQARKPEVYEHSDNPPRALLRDARGWARKADSPCTLTSSRANLTYLWSQVGCFQKSLPYRWLIRNFSLPPAQDGTGEHPPSTGFLLR